ncbi:MAG: polyribonucleotide nucleotidyltransferase [Pseudomonadota bacterium]
MFNITTKETNWGGRTLRLESGRIARQADGAVLASVGDTSVLCTVVAARSVKPGIDFFPLTVNYQEKTYAAGKIPGGFFKREGRPSEKETLTSRLIDRPIRPLFPAGFRNETQVICTVVSHDPEVDADIVAMVGASAALTISGVPFFGPIGGARVGYKDGEYLLNPTSEELAESDLDLIVAGTRDAVLMVESQAKELSEDIMLGAVMFGHQQQQAVIDLIIELAEECAKEPWDLPEPEDMSALKAHVDSMIGDDLRAAYALTVKSDRQIAIAAAKAKLVESYGEEGAEEAGKALDQVKSLEKEIVRGNILKDGGRIDGRALDQVRPIDTQVKVLPRTHGSALFTRGETQALVVATLGTGDDEQLIDALEGSYRESFMLHYNFPPYSVGETGRVGFTGRREVGHGKLAWRAVRAVLPDREAFPYTMRVVSEVTESNGSSSMATVCGTSLALMDAGVPITRPVSGIAMGLILEGEDFAVLSDILGDEDHLGDMDFKVAGTSDGITALQMDIKIAGITEAIMKQALAQAKGGREHILGEMGQALTGARTEMSDYAPRIESFQINKDKIREVIGTGGKVIREITETTGAKIDIEDDGTIKVSSSDNEKITAAVKWIQGIVAEAEVGKIYDGKVVSTVDFGAFVNFIGNKDGLVHISELTKERVEKVTDVVKEGDMVKVKVLGIDDRGKVRLSMRVVDQETGDELEDDRPPRPEGEGRGGRRRRPRD